MIVNRVSRLLGDRRESVADLARATGIAYSTAYGLYRGDGKGVEYHTLNKLCQHFGVTTGELLEYVADDSDSGKAASQISSISEIGAKTY